MVSQLMNLKRSTQKLIIIIPLLIGILSPCFFYFWTKKDSKLSLSKAVEISNEPLPSSRLVEIRSNIDASDKVRKGKVLLIFLSSTCGACKKDIALISKHYSKLISDVQIYGIGFEDKNTLINFVEENQLEFPVLRDENAELFRTLQINYFPTKFLVKDGTILHTWFGNFPNEKKLFEDLEIEELKQ